MPELSYKEVYFHEYCKTCKDEHTVESEEPCNTCLEDPVNLYSHKPTKWSAKE